MSLQELQQFENYRCLYHQVQFLTLHLQEEDKKQQLNIHNHILNRIKQILEMKDENYKKIQEMLTLSIIQCLEDILKVEQSDMRNLYNNLKVLVEYLGHLNEYINNSAQQIILGEVVIDVVKMNEQIKQITKKSRQIFEYHCEFFEKQNELQEIINDSTQNINKSIEIMEQIVIKLQNKDIKQQLTEQSRIYNNIIQKELQEQLIS